MKVLHVIPSVSPARGGPSENLRVSTRALAALGVEVDVATTDDDGPCARRRDLTGTIRTLDGFTIRYFPRQTGFYTFSWPLTLWLWRNARSYQLIHIHALFNYPALAAGMIAALRGVPYILRPLGTLAAWGFRTRRPFLKRLSFLVLEGPLLRRAAAVHCTSEMEREECSRYRTVVVPNPVECGPLEVPLPGSENTIIFLGRLDPKKGLDLLLPAFSAVLAARPGARLHIVGDGEISFVAGLKDTVRHLEIGHAVTFAGFLTGEARRAAWRSASIFVLPSRAENFGISVVEAMERGLAVVVSDQVGICDQVALSHAGLVVRCDSEALAAAILRLLENPASCAQMGRNGRTAAEELYSPESVAGSLSALYQSIREEADRSRMVARRA